MLLLLPDLALAASSAPATYEDALRKIVETESGAAALRESGVPLQTWFFQDAGFAGVAVTGNPSDHTTVLQALQERRGVCVALTAVYLSLAERTGIETVPVATPRHVYVRQRDGARLVNIELLESGAQRPDRYYLLQEKAPEDDPRAQDLLRVIDPGPLLAYLLNNRAVSLRAQGMVDEARDLFQVALRLDHACQPCLYNDANLLAAQGQRRKALRLYDRALKLHPWDADARRNRAHLLGASVARDATPGAEVKNRP